MFPLILGNYKFDPSLYLSNIPQIRFCMGNYWSSSISEEHVVHFPYIMLCFSFPLYLTWLEISANCLIFYLNSPLNHLRYFAGKNSLQALWYSHSWIALRNQTGTWSWNNWSRREQNMWRWKLNFWLFWNIAICCLHTIWRWSC